MTTREDISFLAGSENRVRILEALRDRPHRQSDLVREGYLSRSTVHRTLDGLTDREWVVRDDGRFRLTPGGRLILERYEGLESAVERVGEWGSFLNRLGGDAGALPLAALDDATLIAGCPENPHAALTHLADVFTNATDAERFRGISPVVSTVINEAAFELVSAGVPMELVIDDSVFSTSKASFSDALDDAHAFENIELFQYPGTLEFGLTILDDRVLVGAYDDRGVLRECLDGTDDALFEWATAVYDERRSAARRIDPLASE